MIATLGLADFRIGEIMDLLIAQVDLPRGRCKLADAKTEAGVREVEITLYLRDEPLDCMMDRRARGLSLGRPITSSAPRRGSGATPTASAPASSAGPPRGRARTEPRTGWPRCRRLRRTGCGGSGRRSARWSAATRSGWRPRSSTSTRRFTFSAYQQVATRRYIDEQAVWTLMRFADEPAERVPSRQVTRLQRQDQRGSVPLERDTFDLEVESLTGDGDEP